MRRLFVQFYLLLMACFLAAVLLMGLVYEFTADRAGNRYLEGLVRDSLDRLSQELAAVPPAQWPARIVITSYSIHYTKLYDGCHAKRTA